MDVLRIFIIQLRHRHFNENCRQNDNFWAQHEALWRPKLVPASAHTSELAKNFRDIALHTRSSAGTSGGQRT